MATITPQPVPTGPPQTGPAQYGTAQYGTAQYGTAQYGTAHAGPVQYGSTGVYPAPVRPPRQRRGQNLLAAMPLLMTGLVGLIGTIAVAYYTASGQAYDESALGTISGAGTELNQTLIGQLERVSLPTAMVALVVLMLIAFFRGRVRVGLAAAVLVAGANITTQGLKELLVRPDLGYGVTDSLPSGHTTLVFSLVLAAVLVAPRRLRWLVALAGAAVGGLTGVATVIAGWHRPSDVIAALFVTAAWAAIASAVIAGNPRDRVRGFNGFFPAVLGAGLAAVGLIVYGFGWAAGDDATRVIPFTVILVLGLAGLLTGAYSRLVSQTSN